VNSRKKPRRQEAAAEAPVALGQRQTRNREAIYHVLRSARGPLTVPEIHERTRKTRLGARTGIATIYRTINLLLEKDLIREVILPSGETRYESSESREHHHHFKCNRCQSVFDLEICPVGLPEGTTIPGGFRIESHELTLFGTCPECFGRKSAR
jgi:Fur family ferric uptake transcriptional regulator